MEIEQALEDIGVDVQDYNPSPKAFSEFKTAGYFSTDYLNRKRPGTRDEKLLEHRIAAEKLDLYTYDRNDICIDVAACNSPWVLALRVKQELQAYAIDLTIPSAFSSIDFYVEGNATQTNFEDSSVRGISLQCAFEMFANDDDIDFIAEIKRILEPGGKVLILPLYMHTHYCAYSTPEFFGKGYSDEGAVEYVQMDTWGVPSSRKYDAATFKKRILSRLQKEGLEYDIHVLRNKADLGQNIYCHFILEITKPYSEDQGLQEVAQEHNKSQTLMTEYEI